MFRARRYRSLVGFAAALVFTFFYFARSRDWSYTVVEASIGGHPPHPNQPETSRPENAAAAAAIEESQHRILPNPYRGTTAPPPEKIISPVGPNSGSKDGTSRFKEASSDTAPVKVKPTIEDDPKDSAKEPVKEPVKEPTKVEKTHSLPPPTTDDINSANEEEIDHGGAGRKAAERPTPGIATTKWKKFPERFPVPAEEVIKLPKEQSKTIPKLQAKFKDESSSDKQERLQRLSAIKAEFTHAWKGYKGVAMGHDEVKPLSKESEDPFNGWGATLIDSLDTLWIMQLEDEFSEALDAIKKIDFKTSPRADIPMFETTIRYLGGLLGAYDISGHRYPVLLEKAEELAEVLIGAFDTPNRMPHLYYRWAPEYAAKPHRASSRAGLAEIGSLSLEFTRLAQLTKRDKYYDAIARITNELEKIQDSTSIPGLWPLRVNAQGCSKYSKNTPPQNNNPTREQNTATTTESTTSVTRRTYAAPTDLESYLKLLPRDTNAGIEKQSNNTKAADEPSIQARERNIPSADQCNGGLGLPNSPHDNVYTMGAMADSTYEYLPKEYILLGGLNEQYLNMYKKAATAARKSLLFQPMVKGGRDIRFMASTSPMTPGKIAELTPADLEYGGTHLECFIGGMFAIGAKAFGIDGDLELAAKLTDGCVWAYESTQTGVMPERFRLLPCEKGSACEWDPARFEAGVARYSRVDPEAGHSFRNGESSYEQRVNLISHDAPAGSAGGSVPIPMPGSVNPHDRDVLPKRDGLGNHAEPPSAASSSSPSLSSPSPDEADLQNRDAPRSSSTLASPRIAESGKEYIPAGMTSIPSPAYYLRPEAIESVFIMYRLTGDESWRRKGWQMFEAISKYTRTELANAVIRDVTAQKPIHKDTMESFWLAETLKYFYLLFSDPGVVDLDKYVLEMEPEASETEFWTELQTIVSKPCDSEDQIDDALRAYLSLTTQHKGEYLQSETDISRCSYKLFTSSIFATHADYVRRQILYGLLQDDDPNTLHFLASFILFDGRQNEVVLQMLNDEGVFARLLELIQAMRRADLDGDAGLHRLLMDLVYEMSRIQRVKIEDLVLVDDDFIRCLFDIIEDLSYDVTDPYHYPVIRVLLVLNEQFMISAHDPVDGRPSGQLTNKVIKVLSMYGGMYKTFGENIILLINREVETSLQLLTLKLLYLIFTTPSTYEYFFTNDLHVLVDILIRNLLDLPEEASALRHTYLRVLYPLLAHTQLRNPPHYKRDGLRRLLNVLVRGQVSYGSDSEHEKILHFEEVDETTRRLVARCATVDWLRDTEEPDAETQDTPTQVTVTSIETVLDQTVQQMSPVDIGEPLDGSHTLSRTSTIASSPDTTSPTRTDSYISSNTPGDRKHSLAHRLGMNLEPASSSSLSVQAVAAQHEKPGIITPSRKDGVHAAPLNHETPIIRPPKVKPEPPKSRRWRGRRLAVDEEEQHSAGTSSDGNTIPEGVEVSPTTVFTPSTPPPQTHTRDRRDSGSGSTLAPPGPRPRRSVSNPPPALPPPRRSSHTTYSPSYHRPPIPSPGTGRHGQAPLPPKTRRWGRGKPQHGQSDSVESGASSVSPSKEPETAVNSTASAQQEQPPESSVPSDPFSPKSPTMFISPCEATADKADGRTNGASDVHAPVSVEEAVQNVSLH
ncbi:hypothetical protein N7491_003236 [Penicillium cf. griseofulvum]|uniref:alpha-1,2-Mannosidase n=1 Tax=Penicillium cf. griseofulvum TaxID=2972120 RepID=A0A9W9MRN0_9EURO|nr:hypothetical protein N7472_002593 [Penicillium cf. griseofulvum]KAJ5440830.1 hypothetical protein N7491_003236 [Penicillium cf. griseofulvum]